MRRYSRVVGPSAHVPSVHASTSFERVPWDLYVAPMHSAGTSGEELPEFPVSPRGGGLRPGIDLDDPDQFYRLTYGDLDEACRKLALPSDRAIDCVSERDIELGQRIDVIG